MISHLVATLAATTNSAGGFGSGIINPIAKPVAAVLAFFYSIVPNYGIAILILAVVWMVIISPLTLKTTRSMLAMQKLQPQLKKLQEQHKNDRQAFAQAQMELFKEHNVSPFGSCLPSILPLPVFFALFRVIDGLSHIQNGIPAPQYLSHNTKMYSDIVAAHGHINAFGMDLAKSALSSHSSFFTAIPFFILLLIMIGSQYAQTAQMMSRNPAQANNPQAKLMKFLPLIFGVICIQFPAGVVLYYGMSNLCRIAQQSAMYRYDPKVKALVAQEVIEVEAHTTEIDAGKGKARPAKAATKQPVTKQATAKQPTAKQPAKPPAARGRFQTLLAKQQELQQQRSAAKAGGGSGPGKQGGTAKQGGGAKPNGQARVTSAKSNGTNGTPKPSNQPNQPNRPKPDGGKGPDQVKAKTNGGNGANGGNGVQGKPSNGGGQSAKTRTGASAGRTGARGGPSRKRRGR